jgi:sugar lactone lactonase YvrE
LSSIHSATFHFAVQQKREKTLSAIEIIADYACATGENPLWHPAEQRLYWTDIPTGRLFCFDPEKNAHTQIYAGRPVGGFTFHAEGGLLLFMDQGMIAWWRDGHLTECLEGISAERSSRFNDVIADPTGRVFCGTMSTPDSAGRLYRLDTSGELRVLLEGIGCSNGMAFTRDARTFFYTDSFAGTIYRFDYDIADGSIANPAVFASFSARTGLPDGITIDAEDRVWCAFWDGAAIARLDAQGKITDWIAMPARKITSLTFGGAALNALYITSAGGDDKTADTPHAGALFRMRAPVAGRAEHVARLDTTRITHLQYPATYLSLKDVTP